MDDKKSWVVKVKCEVTKEVICSNCTEEQAHEDPFSYAEDEREIDQTDYEVVSVEPNEGGLR